MTINSLPVLILNPHSRCNCRCTMCDIWKTTGVQELPPGQIEGQLESIARMGVEWVVLSGGEPLMHSALWRICEILRRLRVRITLLSSGLLLRRHAEAIVEHVDGAIVSLDGPPAIHNSIRGVPKAFELLANGVTAIREIEPEFPIAARCTVQRANLRCLRAAADTARSIGLDSISFLAADLESSAFNRPEGWPPDRQERIAPTSDQLSGLESEIEALIDRGECGNFVRESPAKLRHVVHHFRAHLRQAEAVAPRCNAPWRSAVIEADGAVRPCFFHRPIGHLNSGRQLHQILNGPEALAFRASLDVATNPVCRRCVCSLNWPDSAVA
jgi:Fe-coproporphyrin III synthase